MKTLNNINLKKYPYKQYALVAQSGERATVNREVDGSKPSEGVPL